MIPIKCNRCANDRQRGSTQCYNTAKHHLTGSCCVLGCTSDAMGVDYFYCASHFKQDDPYLKAESQEDYDRCVSDNLKRLQSELIDEAPTAIKKDDGKVQLALVKWSWVESAARALTWGAKNKYPKDNYLQGEGLDPERVLNSMLRHLSSYLEGDRDDDESGLNHLDHFNAASMMWYALLKKRGEL